MWLKESRPLSGESVYTSKGHRPELSGRYPQSPLSAFTHAVIADSTIRIYICSMQKGAM